MSEPLFLRKSANNRQEGGDHYARKSIQPWDAMAAWMTPEEFKGFLKGNAIKYLARAGSKGDALTDILKAQHYLEKLIEVERDGKDSSATAPGVALTPASMQSSLRPE